MTCLCPAVLRPCLCGPPRGLLPLAGLGAHLCRAPAPHAVKAHSLLGRSPSTRPREESEATALASSLFHPRLSEPLVAEKCDSQSPALHHQSWKPSPQLPPAPPSPPPAPAPPPRCPSPTPGHRRPSATPATSAASAGARCGGRAGTGSTPSCSWPAPSPTSRGPPACPHTRSSSI